MTAAKVNSIFPTTDLVSCKKSIQEVSSLHFHEAYPFIRVQTSGLLVEIAASTKHGKAAAQTTGTVSVTGPLQDATWYVASRQDKSDTKPSLGGSEYARASTESVEARCLRSR